LTVFREEFENMDGKIRMPAIGTYRSEDVIFLLKNIQMKPTEIAQKELKIQSGSRHYSEMISIEEVPTPEYMELFAQTVELGRVRMGQEIASLALAISAGIEGPITLASLVRAGVPLGVLLKRALRALGRDVEHFGISIIRDRGLDNVAMRHIIDSRPLEGLVFVDGWTGKGAITTQLEESFAAYSDLPPKLVVLADPGGRAWLAASGDDWLIPSGVLGSTVSGLISRSILNADVIGPNDFHGCIQWDHLKEFDLSNAFADDIWSVTQAALASRPPAIWPIAMRDAQRERAARAIAWVASEKAVANINRVKPGIAEATRAILRRLPEMVFISSPADPELAPLMHLIEAREIPYRIAPAEISPYRAITIIQKVS
jgi:hypothetical protein